MNAQQQAALEVPEMWDKSTVVHQDRTSNGAGVTTNRVEYHTAPKRQPAAAAPPVPGQQQAAVPAQNVPAVPTLPSEKPPVAAPELVQQQTATPTQTPPATQPQATEPPEQTTPDALAAIDQAMQERYGVNMDTFMQMTYGKQQEDAWVKELGRHWQEPEAEVRRRLDILATHRNQVAQTDPMRAQGMGTVEGAIGAWTMLPEATKGTPIAAAAPQFDFGGRPIMPPSGGAPQFTIKDIVNPDDPAARAANWQAILQAAATGQIGR